MLKKFLSFAGLILVSAFSAQAQTVQDIFTNSNYTVTWYGIDYSHSKIVGSLRKFGGTISVSAEQLRNDYYTAWNYLILDEPDKYDIARMIKRKTVEKDIAMVKNLNAAAVMDSVEVSITPYYTASQIQSFVSAYPIDNTKGIGLIFIAESMNRSKAEAFYHVVFFNIETKEVLLQQRMRGAAFGFQIRNYWAGSYHSVMEHIRESEYQKWKIKYVPKSVLAPKW